MKKRSIVLKIIFLAFLIYTIATIIYMLPQINKSKAYLAEQKKEAEIQTEKNEQLKNQIAEILSPDFVEQVARYRLGLHKPGQIIFQDISS